MAWQEDSGTLSNINENYVVVFYFSVLCYTHTHFGLSSLVGDPWEVVTVARGSYQSGRWRLSQGSTL